MSGLDLQPDRGPDADASAEPVVNVLVVDDVRQNLLAMQALLRDMPVRVLTASSGAEALELLLVHDVALALLDVQMPGMDGFALAELMRGAQRTRQVPIIFVTATPNDPVRAFKGYESGAVDYLHKPVDAQMLLSKVNVFVELQRQRLLLRARNEELERVLKLNETMIAVLTHDLRTPLSAVMMCAEVIRIHVGDGPAGKSLARLKASAQRMARMIEQLLDFSRIRSDVLRLAQREADLHAVTHAVLAELRQARPAAQVDLDLLGDPQGVFDSDRMGQVVANLVANAVQHGAPGGVVRVTVDGRVADRLGLSVLNVGRLPDELLPRLFEPFKSADKPSEGLGLGLYIVEQFVRAHGGEVSAANQADGVLFTLHIPRRGGSLAA
jgi:two-component system sensor histidine kinase/response regulator